MLDSLILSEVARLSHSRIRILLILKINFVPSDYYLKVKINLDSIYQ